MAAVCDQLDFKNAVSCKNETFFSTFPCVLPVASGSAVRTVNGFVMFPKTTTIILERMVTFCDDSCTLPATDSENLWSLAVLTCCHKWQPNHRFSLSHSQDRNTPRARGGSVFGVEIARCWHERINSSRLCSVRTQIHSYHCAK